MTRRPKLGRPCTTLQPIELLAITPGEEASQCRKLTPRPWRHEIGRWWVWCWCKTTTAGDLRPAGSTHERRHPSRSSSVPAAASRPEMCHSFTQHFTALTVQLGLGQQRKHETKGPKSLIRYLGKWRSEYRYTASTGQRRKRSPQAWQPNTSTCLLRSVSCLLSPIGFVLRQHMQLSPVSPTRASRGGCKNEQAAWTASSHAQKWPIAARNLQSHHCTIIVEKKHALNIFMDCRLGLLISWIPTICSGNPRVAIDCLIDWKCVVLTEMAPVSSCAQVSA